MSKKNMSKPRNSRGSHSRKEEEGTVDVFLPESDRRFFQSLFEFIEKEKQFLPDPEDGAEELRYVIYRSAFNMVIARAKDYKKLLMTIKAEYDDVIMALRRRDDGTVAAEQTGTRQTKPLEICRRRATQLRERVSVLQGETAELEEEMNRRKLSKEQSTWIPGLTVAESEDVDALDRKLKHLEAQRESLLDRKSCCVSMDVKTELDDRLKEAEHQRDQMDAENHRLKVLFQRLRLVFDRLSRWDEKQQLPLEELLGSTLENIRQTSVSDDDACSIDAELFEEEEPTGVDRSKVMTDHLDRFINLFESAQYEEAALLAARSPRGVLRNLDTMHMFNGVEGSPGSEPPPLIFFRALLITSLAGDGLPAPLSLQVVVCALQHNALQLVTHAVTQNKLTFSEQLGDVLFERAQTKPREADLCLALATVVYKACGLDRKTALSMCRRGLTLGAAEFMNHSRDITAEDCLWVLSHSPSLSLLQLLVEPQRCPAAILPVGVACSSLLADPHQQQLALQLLDSFISRGRGVLRQAMLEDSSSSVDVWTEVASLCSGLNRADLGQAVLSVLLDQPGTTVLTTDLEGARLMDHVFL